MSDDGASVDVAEGAFAGEFVAWFIVLGLELSELLDVGLSMSEEWSVLLVTGSSVVVIAVGGFIVSVPDIPLSFSIFGGDSADKDECDLCKFHFFFLIYFL